MIKVMQGAYEIFDDGDEEFNLHYRLVDDNGKVTWYRRYNSTLEPTYSPESEELEIMYEKKAMI